MEIKLNQIKEKDYISTPYSYIGNCHDGLTLVNKSKPNKIGNNSYGYVDRTGKEVIPCIYKAADDFSEGLGLVADKNNNVLIYNTEGKIVANLGTKYQHVFSFHDGLALVRNNKYDNHQGYKFNYINFKGEELLSESVEEAYNFSEGYAIIKINSDYHIIDTFGNIHEELLSNFKKLHPNVVAYFGNFNHGLLRVEYEKNPCNQIRGYITKDGRYLENNAELDKLYKENIPPYLIEEPLNKELLNKFYSKITYFGKTITLCADTKEELQEKKKEFYEKLRDSLDVSKSKIDDKINELTLTK